MNKIKLLSKLQTFFDSDEKKKKVNADEIRDILDKLAKKQLQTQKKLSKCNHDEFKKALQLEIDVIVAQIEKGKRLLNEVADNE
jgi:uncharacterized protein YqeY